MSDSAATRPCAQTTPHDPHVYRPIGKAMPDGEFRCPGIPDTPAASTLRVVWFEETGEERVVVGGCRVCGVTDQEAWDEPRDFVISPVGIAHHVDGDTTDCGKNATGPDWWWAL